MAKPAIIDKNEIDFSNPQPINQLKFSDARSTEVVNNGLDNLQFSNEVKKEEPSEKAETKRISMANNGEMEDDVQARYDALMKSGATAISSDMLFGREE